MGKTTHRGHVFGQITVRIVVARDAEDDGLLLALTAGLCPAAAADGGKSKRGEKERDAHRPRAYDGFEGPAMGVSAATFASWHRPCGTMNG